MPNKLDRYFGKLPESFIEVIGLSLLITLVTLGIIILNVAFPITQFIWIPITAYPIYRFLKAFWNA